MEICISINVFINTQVETQVQIDPEKDSMQLCELASLKCAGQVSRLELQGGANCAAQVQRQAAGRMS